MDSTNEIIFLITGVVIGVVVGGLIIFAIKGRKSGSDLNEKSRQEYENERVKLQTELTHVRKMLEEKLRLNLEKERQIVEVTQSLNEAMRNLSVANERVQTLSSDFKKLTEKTELQANELLTVRESAAQLLANAKALQTTLTEQRTQNNLKEVQIHELNVLNNRLHSENATLSANLNANEGKLATHKFEIEEIRQKSHLEFENIANRLLEAKSERFTATNRENIENILLPLKNDINLFKIKVEETYEKESNLRFSLQNEVKALIQQTDKVSAEANNLATVLKGQTKRQGEWGEMILERVLETAGLTRGREYDVQQPIKTDEGDNQRLDVIIHLPENRKLIIDSKVTLNTYSRFCCAETDEDRNIHLQDYQKAIETHIDQLSRKKYDEMTASLDFVMMFIPIEPAYLLAIQMDSELWSRAYAKHIILISPTNLIAAIKLVADLWKREMQSKNALEIAKQGERLYEKFVGFATTMEEIGKYIAKTQDAYNRAVGQLKQGRGNLVQQSLKLKDLGLNSKKTLPSSMISFDADDFELEIIDEVENVIDS